MYSVLKKIRGANWQQFYIRKNNVNMTFNSMKQMGSKNNFMKILKSTHKKTIQYTVRSAWTLKGFNQGSNQRSKNMGNFKENLSVPKVFHYAHEAFMSMLVRLSWAPVLMKYSWACSWSPNEHMRVKLSRARPLYRIMQTGY